MKITALFAALALARSAAQTEDATSLRAELAETKAAILALKLEIAEDKRRSLLSATVGDTAKTAHDFLTEATAAFTEDRRALSVDSGMYGCSCAPACL
jgi:phytoene/squalene synthetase